MVLAAASPKICQIPEPAKIKVVPKTEKVTLDTSRTLAQIQNENIDTINPYGYNSVTHTNGFMEGRVCAHARGRVLSDHEQPLPGRASESAIE